MTTDTAKEWISRLSLIPHPEGGFYSEVYRSGSTVFRPQENVSRSACTSIYYLLAVEDFSGFHRLAADEIWYYHTGEPLHLHLIGNDGLPQVHELSQLPGGKLSLAIPAHTWFAAEIPGRKGFALCSCAVAPGFEFSEFEMGKKEALITSFPAAKTIIDRLSRP